MGEESRDRGRKEMPRFIIGNKKKGRRRGGGDTGPESLTSSFI